MRPYEVMVIFDPGTEPPAIQASIDRVLETVRTTGGTPGTVDRWGRRPFAYEVKHRREGYYVLIDFAGEVATVNDLDRMLTLNDEVLRHRVIRLPEQIAGRARKGAPPAVPAPGPSAAQRAARAAAEAEAQAAAAAPEPVPEPTAEVEGEEAIEEAGESATVQPDEAPADGVADAAADGAGAEVAEDPAPQGD